MRVSSGGRKEFYSKVFEPAIEAAIVRDERYEDMRDSIRRGWSPARA